MDVIGVAAVGGAVIGTIAGILALHRGWSLGRTWAVAACFAVVWGLLADFTCQ